MRDANVHLMLTVKFALMNISNLPENQNRQRIDVSWIAVILSARKISVLLFSQTLIQWRCIYYGEMVMDFISIRKYLESEFKNNDKLPIHPVIIISAHLCTKSLRIYMKKYRSLYSFRK